MAFRLEWAGLPCQARQSDLHVKKAGRVFHGVMLYGRELHEQSDYHHHSTKRRRGDSPRELQGSQRLRASCLWFTIVKVPTLGWKASTPGGMNTVQFNYVGRSV